MGRMGYSIFPGFWHRKSQKVLRNTAEKRKKTGLLRKPSSWRSEFAGHCPEFKRESFNSNWSCWLRGSSFQSCLVILRLCVTLYVTSSELYDMVLFVHPPNSTRFIHLRKHSPRKQLTEEVNHVLE